MEKIILRAEGIYKIFAYQDKAIEILRDLSVSFMQGNSYAITGVSGIGKSTFMHILAGLDQPTLGSIYIHAKSITTFSEYERSQFLMQSVGLLFQNPYLIRELSVEENVMLPGIIAKMPHKQCRERARDLLTQVHIEEKLNIAKQYLIKKAIADTGLEHTQVNLSDELITDLIMSYTRESGVRQLDRLIHTVCAKIARILVEKNEQVSINCTNIEQHLGPRNFVEDIFAHENQIGISNGLAWTSLGGEILKIEAVLMPGKGKLLLTGQLGDVMKESAQAALTYARAHAKEFGINPTIFTTNDLHIHIPAGSIPKDGPSAGITLLTSILSALTNRPINACYAMTGELNLRGEVMPIGGVKEKILAAKRNKMTHIILPHKNKKDLVDLQDIIDGIDLIFVNHADEVIERVLLPNTIRKIKRA